VDEWRLADIRAGTHSDVASSGSGYLVASAFVLTALHVVTEKCGRCAGTPSCEECRAYPRIEVRLGHPTYGVPSRAAGSLCWRHSEHDLALLRIDPAAPPTQPVRWGWADGHKDLRYSGVGFPHLAQYDDHRRFVEPLSGHFNPISQDPDGFALNQANFAHDVASDGSLWRGASGTAIFCEDLLVAVVSLDDMRFGGRRLRAVPARACVDDPEFVKLLKDSTGVPPNLERIDDNQAPSTAISRNPLISLVRGTTVINIYDRQIANQTIRDLGTSDE
jgi:hypothetical protein